MFNTETATSDLQNYMTKQIWCPQNLQDMSIFRLQTIMILILTYKKLWKVTDARSLDAQEGHQWQRVLRKWWVRLLLSLDSHKHLLCFKKDHVSEVKSTLLTKLFRVSKQRPPLGKEFLYR